MSDVQYYVEVVGSGEPIVMLHGFTGSSQSWHPLTDALKASFQIITIDLLGHGKTDAPDYPSRYEMQHAAKDIENIIQQLDVPPVNLLGYSMGGRLALYMALHHSHIIKRLILESASPGLQNHDERDARKNADNDLAEKLEKNGIEWFVNTWENIALFETQKQLSDSIQQQQRTQRLNNSTKGLANSLRGMGTGVQPSLWGKLDMLSIPVLLLTGKLDTKFTALAHKMAALIPEVQVCNVANAGHTIHLEKPDVFTAWITTFLQST